MQGIVGTISGRSGNQVFSKGRNGETIMRAYQPQVVNPKSAGQVNQRNRFSVAAKTAAALMDVGGLYLLARGRKAGARGSLVADLLRIQSVALSTSSFNTSVASEITEQLSLLRPNGDFSISMPTITGEASAITVLVNVANAQVNQSVGLVVMVSPAQPTPGTSIIISRQAVAVASEAGSLSASLSIPLTDVAAISTGEGLRVYAVAMSARPSLTGNLALGMSSVNTNMLTAAAAQGVSGVVSILENVGDMLFSNMAVNTSVIED